MSSKKPVTTAGAGPAPAATHSATAQFTAALKALQKTQAEQVKIAKYQAQQSFKTTQASQETALTNRFLWHSKHRGNIILAIIVGVLVALLVQLMFNLYMNYKYMIEGVNSAKGLQSEFPNGWAFALGMEYPFVARSFVGSEALCYAVYQSFYSTSYVKYFQNNVSGNLYGMYQYYLGQTGSGITATDIICNGWGCKCGVPNCQSPCPPKKSSKNWWVGGLVSSVLSGAAMMAMPGVGWVAGAGMAAASMGGAAINHYAGGSDSSCTRETGSVNTALCGGSGTYSCK